MRGGGELPLCTVRKNLGGSGVEFHWDLNALDPTEFRTVIMGYSSLVNPSKNERDIHESPCFVLLHCLACKPLDLRNFT